MLNKNATDKQEIIDGLNEDLAREYQAIIQYVKLATPNWVQRQNAARQKQKQKSKKC